MRFPPPRRVTHRSRPLCGASRPVPSWASGLFSDPLLRNADKQRTRHLAVFTDKRRVVCVITLTKNGRRSGKRMLFDQGFVSSAIMIEFRINSGLVSKSAAGALGSVLALF